jgi:predicted P-loop ATPase
MDYVLCLKGKQGLKKSEFWRTITGEEYFAETQQKDLKDLRMTMNCCWIYEYPEIEQLTSKKDVGAIKALITQRKDQFRPPFGSSVGIYPRKSILVGSLNEDEFLKDRTGSRRFWVIDLPYDPDLGEQLDIPKLKRDRDRILKAAILAYRSGRLPMLTLEQEVQSKKQNLNYESEHPFQSAVEQQVRKWKNAKFSTKSILIDSELRTEATINQKDMNDVAAILRGLGYVRDKNQTTNQITKERSRLWSLAQSTHS